jgi:hypothetical protein
MTSTYSALRTPHSEFDDAPYHPGPWRGVFFDGPQSDQDHEGDEIPAWFVYVGDEEAEPVGIVYKFNNFKPAEELAKRMSYDRRLELIHEATPA